MDDPTTTASSHRVFLRVDEEMWDQLEVRWTMHIWTIGRAIEWSEVQEKLDAFELKYGSLNPQ